MRDQDELLTAAEVAQECRVQPVTVRRWAKAGRLAAITLPGGSLRFRRSDVDKAVTHTERRAS